MIPLRYPTPTPPKAPNSRRPRGGDYADLENLDRPELDELDGELPPAPLLPLDWEDLEGESGVKQVTKRS